MCHRAPCVQNMIIIIFSFSIPKIEFTWEGLLFSKPYARMTVHLWYVNEGENQLDATNSDLLVITYVYMFILMCICLSYVYMFILCVYVYLMCICLSHLYLLYLTCICCILCVFVVLLCVFVVFLCICCTLMCIWCTMYVLLFLL